MERYICIHGHFYQPPRQNPWLEAIELQDSAYPYHDWNERIAAECYAPNAASRILDEQGRIAEIVNNYARISFNFGPTLLAWMESSAPDTYRAVLEADQESQKNFSGHGSALAQPYNHMILPLANGRDLHTQVLWGIRDFERRFGRSPEGMWLPETAVNLKTLEVLAELGIRFTILAPRQARRARPIGARQWQDVSGGGIDPTMAYTLRLSSGRSIALFFYDDPIARAVAFGGLLASGERFALWLASAFSNARPWPQIVNIAADGETYGHHHRFGDMGLAYALHYIESNNLARITNYGEYLEKHPPTHEVEILENTSWSCAHGLERWRSNCGCSPSQHPDWNQEWRAPLREALDWLRDNLATKYEKKAKTLLKDPWLARDDYIEVILDRSPDNVERFFTSHAVRPLDQSEKVAVLKLLEIQRHAMLMYTSCGWFFEDLSGLETMQVMRFASRATQLAQEVLGGRIEARFLGLLERAKSNLPQYGDGRQIYERFIKPAMLDMTKVTANYAVSSLFEERHPEKVSFYRYTIGFEDHQSFEAGRARMAVGRTIAVSDITQESAVLVFAVLHFGDHYLNAGVGEYQGEAAYQKMASDFTSAFSIADFPQIIRLLDRHFGNSTYSLRSLLRDEQRKVLEKVLAPTIAEIEANYRHLYESSYPLMRFLTELGHPLPKALYSAAEFIISLDLRKALGSEPLDLGLLRGILEEAKEWNVRLDSEGLGYLFAQRLEETMARFVSTPTNLHLLEDVAAAVEMARSVPFEVNLWKVQNLYYEMLNTSYPEFQTRAQQRRPGAREWLTRFVSLGERLSIRVD